MSHLSPVKSLYRGSPKHKNRPTGERKGTLCPEWTHNTVEGGYRNDPFVHPWEKTEAHKLFADAIYTAGGQRCYATAQGIAFEGKPTADGTWHGYPIPWEAVPYEILQKWKDEKKVTGRQVKKHLRHDEDDLRWAIEGVRDE